MRICLGLVILCLLSSHSGFTQERLRYDLYYYDNPQHEMNIYNNILVVTDWNNKKFKDKVKKKVGKLGYVITFEDELFPPYKNWTDEEISKKIDENGVDAIFYFTRTGVNTSETVLSSSTYRAPTNGILNWGFNTKTTKSTQVEGVDLEMTFVDLQTRDEAAFYCTGYVGGKMYPACWKAFFHTFRKFADIGIAMPPINFPE